MSLRRALGTASALLLSVAVAVWGMSSLLIQVTVAPRGTVTTAGLKVKLSMRTVAAACATGGAMACAAAACDPVVSPQTKSSGARQAIAARPKVRPVGGAWKDLVMGEKP